MTNTLDVNVPGSRVPGSRVNDSDDPLLCMGGVRMRFGGTRALDDVALEVRRGEIVTLLGENGAGKSTLIKILAGIEAMDSGAIAYAGATPRRRSGACRSPSSIRTSA